MSDYIKSNIGSGYNAATNINTELGKIETAIASKVDEEGGVMTGDLQMNSNDILNAGQVSTNTLILDGVALTANNPINSDTTITTTRIVATAGQTVFTVPSYSLGINAIQVFLNGVKLSVATDYAETNTTTITLTNGASVNDVFEALIGSTVTDANNYDSALVTYTQGGTGSVATNVRAKLQETVSVSDFGAVGDGVTDDTAAIQAAIDYALANGGGKVIFPMPESFWLTTDTINLGTGVDVEFHGSGYRNGAYNYIRPSSACSMAVQANEIDGAKIYGLSIDMQDMLSGAVGIDNRSSWNVKWERCNVFNINQASSIGIKAYSEASAGQGNYWQHYEDCTSVGTAGTAWRFLGQSSGFTRLTSQTIVNCQSYGTDVGWDIDYAGSMMIAINISAESHGVDGIQYDNTPAGNQMALYSGELTGNAGIGLNASDTIICRDMVFSSNGTNYTSSVVNQRANSIITGDVESRFVADRFQSKLSIVTLLASDTISSQYGYVRVSGNGGAVTLTSDPQIADPTDSNCQTIVIMGGSNTNTVTLVDGQGLRLKGNAVLGLEDTITLAYHSSFGDWVEISRSIRPSATYTPTNVSTDRSYDANATTTEELADVLGTLIADLQDKGLIS